MTPAEVREVFAALPSWPDRYEWLIGLGRALPEMPSELIQQSNLVPGCSSRAWLAAKLKNGQLEIRVDAESAITRGVAALLRALAHGRTPAEFAELELRQLFAELELDTKLSPNRAAGLGAMLARVEQAANLR